MPPRPTYTAFHPPSVARKKISWLQILLGIKWQFPMSPSPFRQDTPFQSGHIHQTSSIDNPPHLPRRRYHYLTQQFTVRVCPLASYTASLEQNGGSAIQVDGLAKWRLLLPSRTWFQEKGTEGSGSDTMTPVSISFYPPTQKRFKEKAKRFGMIPHEMFLNFCDIMEDIIMNTICHLSTSLRAHRLPLVITRIFTHGSVLATGSSLAKQLVQFLDILSPPPPFLIHPRIPSIVLVWSRSRFLGSLSLHPDSEGFLSSLFKTLRN